MDMKRQSLSFVIQPAIQDALTKAKSKHYRYATRETMLRELILLGLSIAENDDHHKGAEGQ